jgi:hypothetical protein
MTAPMTEDSYPALGAVAVSEHIDDVLTSGGAVNDILYFIRNGIWSSESLGAASAPLRDAALRALTVPAVAEFFRSRTIHADVAAVALLVAVQKKTMGEGDASMYDLLARAASVTQTSLAVATSSVDVIFPMLPDGLTLNEAPPRMSIRDTSDLEPIETASAPPSSSTPSALAAVGLLRRRISESHPIEEDTLL